jgi:DNA-binding PadR family transcriptional regulator
MCQDEYKGLIGLESFIEKLLTKGEYLVYQYIKEEAEKHGSVKQSLSDMANAILERYYDLIPTRKRKLADGSEVEEKGMSEGTVHRAIQKLKREGLIVVRPSEDKIEPNEIFFYGLPDEEEQVADLVEMATKLHLSVTRFQAILSSKEAEIEKLKASADQLYSELNIKNEVIRRQEELIAQLQKEIQQLASEDSPLKKGVLIGTKELGHDTIAFLVKIQKG